MLKDDLQQRLTIAGSFDEHQVRKKNDEVIVVIFLTQEVHRTLYIIQDTSDKEFSGAKQSTVSLKGLSTVHKEVSMRVGIFGVHSRLE